MSVETRNHTPFPFLGFESRGHRGEPFHILIVKATFHLKSGDYLRLLQDQPPLCMSDEYIGEPGQSSVVRESDLSPFKPTSDVTLSGTARNTTPSRAWLARLKVGTTEKTLRLTGPRKFYHRLIGGWGLSDPTPTTEVPVRYELAYGGWAGPKEKADVCNENPIGRCHLGRYSPVTKDELPAPQIEDPNDPITTLGKHHRPQGFGPIGRAWAPRLAKAGVFDDEWLATRWPDIPDNFDFAHYNSAHPDLVAPQYLKGDEPIHLDGFLADGPVQTALPSYLIYARVRLNSGQIAPCPLHLDTLHFDVDANTVALTWRARIPARFGIRVLEACLRNPQKGAQNGR